MNTWKKENVTYIPWVAGLALLFFIILEVVKSTIQDLFQFETDQIIFYFSTLFIPLFTVNVIFGCKLIYKWIYPEGRNLLPARLLGLVVGVVSATVLVEFIYAAYGIVDDDNYVLGAYVLSPSVSEVIDNTFLSFLFGIPLFIKHQVKENSLLMISKKEKELNLAYQLKLQSELDALQSKVNPHFLYNSLNSIACLIHEDPNKAERMVLLLSDLFRYTLNYNKGNFSTIKEELKMVRAYLEIELIRFEDSLKCELEVDESLGSVLIPRFLLQPLVENAIKHGTSKKEKGLIQLKITEEGANLKISVADNGAAFPEELVSGYGLKGTLDKLNLLYKGDFEFKLNNQPVKEVKITLKNISRE